LNTPGPRRLLKPLLPRKPVKQTELLGSMLLGSNVSPKANGSYQKPDILPIFFGFPNELLIGGELPSQAAPQSPKTVNGVPLKMLIKLLTCHPDTTAVSAPLPPSHFWPRPSSKSQTLVITILCVISNPVGARFMFM